MTLLSTVMRIGSAFTRTTPLVLGGVSFTRFELPDELPWGGEQRVQVHKLPGGARIVDAMGPDDCPIEWNGILHGPYAQSRARRLDAMRVSGGQVMLTWGGYARLVAVTHFECRYARQGYWCSYSIRCEVIAPVMVAAASGASALASLVGSDAAAAIDSVTSAVTEVAATVSDIAATAQATLAQAMPLLSLAGPKVAQTLSGISGDLGAVQAGAAGVGMIAGAPAAVAGTVASLQTAASSITAGVASLGSGLDTVATAAPAGSLVASADGLATATTYAGGLAAATAAQGYVARANVNASNAARAG